jgi:hypothetical protein
MLECSYYHLSAKYRLLTIKRGEKMGSKKAVGIALLVVGIIVLALSLLAEPLGIGGPSSGFGPYQIAGTVVGVVVALVGLVLALRG